MKKQKYDKKVKIGKGKKERKVPQRYVPTSLSAKDKKKQEESILKGTKRPKLDSFKSKRSGWASKFEKKYKTKITDTDFIDKNILKEKGQKEVISIGMKAYFTSGSRPNQTPFSWGLGRLASVIMNGPSRKIDIAIWKKYKR